MTRRDLAAELRRRHRGLGATDSLMIGIYFERYDLGECHFMDVCDDALNVLVGARVTQDMLIAEAANLDDLDRLCRQMSRGN